MRVGIANDMPIAVEVLRRALALDPSHHVAWVARDGLEAVRACAADRPDLILMDLLMPVMDGVEATRQIMAAAPCAILIVTASIGANAWRTFEAMGHGALDAVDTPDFASGDLRQNSAALLNKIDTIGRLIGDQSQPADRSVTSRRGMQQNEALLAIGASAGGPAALAQILSSLPAAFPAPIVIAQHVDAQFAPGLASWLNQYSAIPVHIAQEGETLQRGAAFLACTNDHMCLISATHLGYTADPVSYAYRPSVDVLFQSVSHLWHGRAVGVLLTGMGRDGAVGLRALRMKGHHTIAQDKASSAVYGMPKAAATIGAASEILGLDHIAPRLIDLFARSGQA